MYMNGYGIEKTLDQEQNTIKNQHKAAEKENENAQYVLGRLYYEGYNNGFEIIKNEEKGLNLIKMAADKGYEQAIETIEKLKKVNNTMEDNDEYNVEDYVGFTNVDNINLLRMLLKLVNSLDKT